MPTQPGVPDVAHPADRLATDRLLIRRFRPDDAGALHAYLCLPEAVRYEPYGVQTLVECEREAERRSHDPAFWAVCLADGGLIGNLYLAPDGPPRWRTFELGYVFHPAQWGRGYATEAVTALVGQAFANWQAHRVVALCNPANTASWRLLERCGLRREGHLRNNASFADGPDGAPVWQDTYLYAVLAEEWSAL